jgi:excisionase family DNA binding protein
MSPKPEPIKTYFNLAEAAAYMSVSRRTLYGWVESRRIPFHKVGGKTIKCKVGRSRTVHTVHRGGRILFSRTDLDEWLNGQRIPAEVQR